MAAAASFVLALTVHALALGLLAGGVALIVVGWGQFFSMVVGAILVACSIFLRPRVARRESQTPSLTRDEAPHIFALLDQIAKELGTRNVDVIEFGPDYNAAVYEYGVRRRRCRFIGFALWETLTPQERVAICSHELGHFANHNPRHGLVIATAFRSLREWYLALLPDTNGGGLLAIAQNGFLALLRGCVLGTAIVLERLTIAASQRNEYLADEAAARVASSQAAASALASTLWSESVTNEVHRLTVSRRMTTARNVSNAGVADFWSTIAAHASSIPPRERTRLHRVNELRGHGVDDTHPPTHLRIARLKQGNYSAVVVTDSASARLIDKEFADVKEHVAMRLLRP